MSYIQDTLLKNEQLTFATRPHWIVFGMGTFTLFIALLSWIYLPNILGSGLTFFGWQLSDIVATVIAVIGAYWLIQAYIYHQTSEYGITDKRVLMKTGWVMRDAAEIFLEKIEAIQVDQSVVGRILNYGTLSIIGTGGTPDVYLYIPEPMEFRKKVQQQMERRHTG